MTVARSPYASSLRVLFEDIASCAVVLALLITALVVVTPSANASAFNFNSDPCAGICGPLNTAFETVTLSENARSTDIAAHLNSLYISGKTGFADDAAGSFAFGIS